MRSVSFPLKMPNKNLNLLLTFGTKFKISGHLVEKNNLLISLFVYKNAN